MCNVHNCAHLDSTLINIAINGHFVFRNAKPQRLNPVKLIQPI